MIILGPWHTKQTYVKLHCFFLLQDSTLESTSKKNASEHFISTGPDNNFMGNN